MIFPGSIQLRPCRDVVIHHEKMKLFLPVALIDRREQHAAGLNAHHGARRQVRDCNQRLSDQLFRLVVSANAAEIKRASSLFYIILKKRSQWYSPLASLLYGKRLNCPVVLRKCLIPEYCTVLKVPQVQGGKGTLPIPQTRSEIACSPSLYRNQDRRKQQP